MTRKQMKKLAIEIHECEQIRANPNATKEAKVKAENRIITLTNRIMVMKDAPSILMEIDAIISGQLKGDK